MSEQANWTVELYERPDGSSPVVEFIEEQSRSNQAKILAELDDLAEFGLVPSTTTVLWRISPIFRSASQG
jgi:hypothetical protein